MNQKMKKKTKKINSSGEKFGHIVGLRPVPLYGAQNGAA